MRPVNPLVAARNPVTLIENMTRVPDGSLARRSGFAAGGTLASGEPPRNDITTYLSGLGLTAFVLKSGTGWYYRTAIGSGYLNVTTSLLTNPNADPTVRGSFNPFSGELYYCDRETVWRWDGALTGAVDVGMPEFQLSAFDEFSYCALLDPNEEPKWYRNGCTFDADTCEIVGSGCNLTQGGKMGTFAASFSWYDPARNIYGPRSRPETIAIAAFIDGEPVKLFGYKYLIPTPDNGDESEKYEIAVWCSQSIGVSIVAGRVICGPPDGDGNTNCDTTIKLSHQFGDYLSDVHFLEGFAQSVGDQFQFLKDNASLAASGRALDTFEAPRPSQFMAVLKDGTALYFNPSYIDSPGVNRYVIEYSVGHPEQVGRDRDYDLFPQRRSANGPTITYASGVRGKPIAFVDVGSADVVLTDQEVYNLGFGNGQAQFLPIGQGRGVRSEASITVTPLGVFYLSDVGHVLVGGDGASLIDRRLGYASYTDELKPAVKARCPGGSVNNFAFLWMPDFDPLEIERGNASRPNVSDPYYAALVYDHAERHLVKFTFGDTSFNARYATGATLQDGSALFLFDAVGVSYTWPSDTTKDGSSAFPSRVRMYLNDEIDRSKTIESVIVTFGKVTGKQSSGSRSGPRVTIDAYEHDGLSNEKYQTRTMDPEVDAFNYSSDVSNRRVVYPQFSGMQGRLFRITVETADAWDEGEMTVLNVEVVYDADEPTDHLGAA